jgi:diaminopimelate decarboxylase
MGIRPVVITILLCFALLFSIKVRAQYSGAYDYSVETVWGVTKATNSGLIGGFMFKYARKLKDNQFHGGIIEIVNVKHPQEQRIYSEPGNTFIWGKQHYLYSIRLL